jgi:hypothetical protein
MKLVIDLKLRTLYCVFVFENLRIQKLGHFVQSGHCCVFKYPSDVINEQNISVKYV